MSNKITELILELDKYNHTVIHCKNTEDIALCLKGNHPIQLLQNQISSLQYKLNSLKQDLKSLKFKGVLFDAWENMAFPKIRNAIPKLLSEELTSVQPIKFKAGAVTYDYPVPESEEDIKLDAKTKYESWFVEDNIIIYTNSIQALAGREYLNLYDSNGNLITSKLLAMS